MRDGAPSVEHERVEARERSAHAPRDGRHAVHAQVAQGSGARIQVDVQGERWRPRPPASRARARACARSGEARRPRRPPPPPPPLVHAPPHGRRSGRCQVEAEVGDAREAAGRKEPGGRAGRDEDPRRRGRQVFRHLVQRPTREGEAGNVARGLRRRAAPRQARKRPQAPSRPHLPPHPPPAAPYTHPSPQQKRIQTHP